MNKKYCRQSGRSMLELLAILAILGTVSAGVYGMASNALSARRQMNTVLEVHNIISKIHDTFAWTDNYEVTDGSTIQEYLEDQGIVSESRLQLPSGNALTITSSSKDKYRTFTLTIRNADFYICRALVLEDWGDRLVGAKAATDLNPLPPLTAGEIATACRVNGTVNVELTFL